MTSKHDSESAIVTYVSFESLRDIYGMTTLLLQMHTVWALKELDDL